MHRLLVILAGLGVLAAQPQLRLELGFHTGEIKSLAADSSQRYLVTASEDKTVRVWEIATGRQLKVLRPPIGNADEGKMFAAAIAPDGATIAAGGWTGAETHSIYIFDRESGRMLHRIAGLPDVTLRLAYSPGGDYLVAALGSGGVRLYRTSDYGLAGEDRNYEGSVNRPAFSPAFDQNRLLATAAEDRFVRLYRVTPTGRLQLLRRRQSEEKDEPLDVAFSPDSAALAVTFDYDTNPLIEVWKASTLARLYQVDGRALGGRADRIAWSADGKLLYVAGGLGFGGLQIGRFDQGGRGEAQGVETGEEPYSVSEILPLRNGSLLFASNQPALGLVEANWKDVRRLTPPGPGFPGLGDNRKFLLSRDGTSLRFFYGPPSGKPAWLSVPRHALVPGETASGFAGKPPDDDSLEVILGHEVQLNRKLLALRDGEIGIAVADAPGGKRFVLATQWRLVLFDDQGQELWQAELRAEPAAVNISGDGRLAAAALRDGTIRWYRMSDGHELLAFFPHADQKRWVLWTPEGFYDGSDGAEELFGFHSNHGDDQAGEFVPAATLRSTYYKPDVVRRALQ